ncbi:MAG TPA: hypothetical protein VLA20_05565 [Vicinamibacterales bacterium]|nr:hypothetical protein [Vicinamibacterales bacterium]
MSKHQPALLAGLFIGVLSSLPVVSTFNLCCCLWVVTGGVLVVYLQQQRTPEPVETADAVIGGLIAGVVGAIVAALGALVLLSAGGELWQEQVRQALDSSAEVPPEVRDMLLNLIEGGNLALLALVINLPVYGVFGMLGSLLGLAFFRKKVAPPPAQTS